jgi:hypothetical protein
VVEKTGQAEYACNTPSSGARLCSTASPEALQKPKAYVTQIHAPAALHPTGRLSDTHCGDNLPGRIQPKSSATLIHAFVAFALTALAGPATLTTVETACQASNRHSKPQAGQATPLQRRQQALQNAPI